jgi:hypothetical protein
MAFKRNLHSIDIVVRTLLGIALVYIGFIDTTLITNNVLRLLIGAFGAINIVAAVMRHCPVYGMAGISSYRNKD